MVLRLDRRPVKTADEYIIIDASRTTIPESESRPKEELLTRLLFASVEWIEMASAEDSPIVLSQKQLDNIIERSKKIGAIHERLDSINSNLEAWAKRIDDRLGS